MSNKKENKQTNNLPDVIEIVSSNNLAHISTSKNKLKNAKEGEMWIINDGPTRGHISSITSNNKTDRKKGNVKHLPITHAIKTRGMKNIVLQENPDKNDLDENGKPKTSRILPKVQKSSGEAKAKKKDDIKIKNPIDKSIRRHLRKEDKKKKSKDVDEK